MSEAKDTLVRTCRSLADEGFRDLWVFDRVGYERLYARSDVDERLEGLDVGKYIDNERFGYITRDTYEALHYATYRYTVRGFDGFDQVRLFLREDGGSPVGVLVSFDHGAGVDYGLLHDRIVDVSERFPLFELRPEIGDDRVDAR